MTGRNGHSRRLLQAILNCDRDPDTMLEQNLGRRDNRDGGGNDASTA
jgi:hypothetical protein